MKLWRIPSNRSCPVAKGVFIKAIGGLKPADEDAEAIIAAWKLGEARMIEITRPRNLGSHRLLWAIIGLVWQNVEGYPSREALMDVVKIGCGHVEPLTLPDGSVWMRPKSISFAAQDEDGFKQFLDRALTFITTRLLPGLDRQDLLNEVDQILR